MAITGHTLIELGFKPGKWFGAAIEAANRQQLAGDSLIEFLHQCEPQQIVPFSQPVPFHKNIRAESEFEVTNVELVEASMSQVMRTPTVVTGAVMPDACPTGPAGHIPVGGVAVTRDAIHPAMHSADICCSVMATNCGFVAPKLILDAAMQSTHFGPGGRADLIELPQILEERSLENEFLAPDHIQSVMKSHLGSQGDGNHFVFVGQSRDTGETMLVTHHGSRGLGAKLYKEGRRVAETFRRELSPATQTINAWIPYSESVGKSYWAALQITREWTKTNHAVLHDLICHRVNIEPHKRFWNEHNFVFKRDDLFFHAKGATPLIDEFVPDSEEGLRLIPLNMSEPILIVKGEATETNLGFAPHGAGRNISRSQHKRMNDSKSIEQVFAEETNGLDVRFFSGNIDISELPSAYKDANTVKAQMQEFGLGRVVDEIIPYGSIMAGDWQKDASWRKRR